MTATDGSAHHTCPGTLRFTETGDVEIFDGTAWTPIRPLAHDPDGSTRGDPAPPHRSAERPPPETNHGHGAG